MFVHFHNREDSQCDGCGRQRAIVDMLSTQSERGLRFCKTCFRELTASLLQAAAKLRLKPAAQA
jgi:ribosomal protein S14